MHLIITDPWFAKHKAIHVSGWRLFTAALLAATVFLIVSVFTYHSVFVYGARQGWPVVTPLVDLLSSRERQNQERYLRENLDALARKLGELQARLVQLESLGERVSQMAGVPMADVSARAGSGGALVDASDLTLSELDRLLSRTIDRVDGGGDRFALIESRLFAERVRKAMLPTQEPVMDAATGSGFGFRIDPVTGQRAMHTGLDFPAEPGTPILAAAGGVVVTQEFHPAYGQMVEIDHGNGLITRYAHASHVHVARGDIVRRGQRIADVGSTGRSTGPHLHFEVWLNGVVQDPQVFLSAGRERPRTVAAQADTKR